MPPAPLTSTDLPRRVRSIASGVQTRFPAIQQVGRAHAARPGALRRRAEHLGQGRRDLDLERSPGPAPRRVDHRGTMSCGPQAIAIIASFHVPRQEAGQGRRPGHDDAPQAHPPTFSGRHRPLHQQLVTWAAACGASVARLLSRLAVRPRSRPGLGGLRPAVSGRPRPCLAVRRRLGRGRSRRTTRWKDHGRMRAACPVWGTPAS